MTTYTIKPLVWCKSVGRDRWYADTVLGMLMVAKTNGSWSWTGFYGNEDSEVGGQCESRKDGIAKAEAFYFEGIKRALEVCDADSAV